MPKKSVLLSRAWEALEWQREAEGLTQTAVSLRLGKRRDYWNWMKGHQFDMRLSTLERYARALGKQVRIYLEDDDHEHSTASSVVKHPNVRLRNDQRSPFPKRKLRGGKSLAERLTHTPEQR